MRRWLWNINAAIPFRPVGFSLSLSALGRRECFYARRGANARCFGGKTLRGPRNLIMWMFRRVIAATCFIYGVSIESCRFSEEAHSVSSWVSIFDATCAWQLLQYCFYLHNVNPALFWWMSVKEQIQCNSIKNAPIFFTKLTYYWVIGDRNGLFANI